MTERWFLCSSSARSEARLLASIDVIMSSFALILLILLTYFIFEYPHLLQQYVDEDPENRQDLLKLLKYGDAKKALFLSIPLLRASVSWLLGILLFIGAQKRSYIQVRIWFIISIIYIVIDLILFVPRTIYTQDGKLYVIISLLNFIYMIYELWIVFVLLSELRALLDEEAEAEDPVTEDTVVVDADEEKY